MQAVLMNVVGVIGSSVIHKGNTYIIYMLTIYTSCPILHNKPTLTNYIDYKAWHFSHTNFAGFSLLIIYHELSTSDEAAL